MKVYYIAHSGFLVETGACCYLFDYWHGELPALDPDKPVVVLASHFHPDHYNPEVFPLLARAGVKHVLAVLANDISPKKYPDEVDVLTVSAHRAYDLPWGGRLETLLSTDSGVAFLLTTDEGTVYHAGDLNDWTWEGEPEEDNRQMRGSYRHEIGLLAGRHMDLAFVPLDPRLEGHYADGLVWFLDHTDTDQVLPMHYWNEPEVIDRFLAEYPRYRGIVAHTEDFDIAEK